jgi:adenylate cyclase
MSAQHTEPVASGAEAGLAANGQAAAAEQSSDAAAELIEEALLGGPRRFSRQEATAAVGVSQEWGHRIWLALGFADVDENAKVFTDNDVEALRAFQGLVAAGKIAPDDELPHVRAMGQAMSRLADWQVREIMGRISEVAGSDEAARAELAAEMTDELIPVVERLQSYAWRRHVVAAVGRILPVSPAQLSTATVAVGFADIVGYTSTVRHTDINELARFLESFEENAAETVVSQHGRVVKSLGDEILFVADEARNAAEIGVQLADWGRAGSDLPRLRVGMALGQVLTRLGDVYGPAVNVASRLTSLARPGTVLVDRELAQALGQEGGYRLQARRPATVRGYHHLRSWALSSIAQPRVR